MDKVVDISDPNLVFLINKKMKRSEAKRFILVGTREKLLQTKEKGDGYVLKLCL